jgi:hypothetical protein
MPAPRWYPLINYQEKSSGWFRLSILRNWIIGIAQDVKRTYKYDRKPERVLWLTSCNIRHTTLSYIIQVGYSAVTSAAGWIMWNDLQCNVGKEFERTLQSEYGTF